MTKQQKILVVDDEDTIATMIAEALRDEDYDVQLAFDGHKGIAIACVFYPDLILTDVMMPHMDGLRMAEIIQQKLGTQTPPIVFMSAVDCRAQTQVMGAFLAKPFTLDSLFDIVDSQLP